MSEVKGPENQQVKMNYGGNSNKQKEAVASEPAERVRINKVVDGTAVERKKGISRRIKDHFQGENDMQSIGSYIFWDVIVPKMRDLAVDAIREGTDRAFYGDSRRSSASSSRGSASSGRTAYSRIYQSAPEPRSVSQRARGTHDFSQEILIPTLGEAEKVIDTLIEYVDKYGFVSVLDLYDAAGITGGEFTDEKYGWDNLGSARTIRTREGYLLDLPPTKQRS
jgi:hypothetical protein